jgi:hypothetical protein
MGSARVSVFPQGRYVIMETGMNSQSVGLVASAIAIVGACLLAPSAKAGDFFSALFGAFGGRPWRPPTFLPFAAPPADAPHVRFADGPAWCVRSCDGRYFPIQGPDRQSHVASCSSFCPATKTELVYGSEIANATTESGKPYSELPNAFRYRNEIVAGCTCNGKDPVGLAQVSIERDPTLRKGDIVAGETGLVVTGRARDQQAAASFSHVPDSTRTRYRRVPVVASE